MKILTINVGSSSIKYSLFENQKEREKGQVKTLTPLFKKPFDVVCHRIVHGGKKYYKPARLTSKVIHDLKKITLAPLHLPPQLKIVQALKKRFPQTPQFACFDTAFFHHLPKLSQTFPLPQNLDVRKYGFHGLSYEYIVHKIQPARTQKTIICHLGNGCSMAALHGKKPIDTTMGLTPMGGMMMGTRPGDLDPGLILYLSKKKKGDLEKFLDTKCGLLGVSGLTKDMGVLLKSKKPSAKFAIDLFCYQAAKHIGALAATLNGLHLLIFTGGIGEKSALIRNQIKKHLSHLKFQSKALKTNEDFMMARHIYTICKGSTSLSNK